MFRKNYILIIAFILYIIAYPLAQVSATTTVTTSSKTPKWVCDRIVRPGYLEQLPNQATMSSAKKSSNKDNHTCDFTILIMCAPMMSSSKLSTYRFCPIGNSPQETRNILINYPEWKKSASIADLNKRADEYKQNLMKDYIQGKYKGVVIDGASIEISKFVNYITCEPLLNKEHVPPLKVPYSDSKDSIASVNDSSLLALLYTSIKKLAGEPAPSTRPTVAITPAQADQGPGCAKSMQILSPTVKDKSAKSGQPDGEGHGEQNRTPETTRQATSALDNNGARQMPELGITREAKDTSKKKGSSKLTTTPSGRPIPELYNARIAQITPGDKSTRTTPGLDTTRETRNTPDSDGAPTSQNRTAEQAAAADQTERRQDTPPPPPSPQGSPRQVIAQAQAQKPSFWEIIGFKKSSSDIQSSPTTENSHTAGSPANGAQFSANTSNQQNSTYQGLFEPLTPANDSNKTQSSKQAGSNSGTNPITTAIGNLFSSITGSNTQPKPPIPPYQDPNTVDNRLITSNQPKMTASEYFSKLFLSKELQEQRQNYNQTASNTPETLQEKESIEYNLTQELDIPEVTVEDNQLKLKETTSKQAQKAQNKTQDQEKLKEEFLKKLRSQKVINQDLIDAKISQYGNLAYLQKKNKVEVYLNTPQQPRKIIEMQLNPKTGKKEVALINDKGEAIFLPTEGLLDNPEKWREFTDTFVELTGIMPSVPVTGPQEKQDPIIISSFDILTAHIFGKQALNEGIPLDPENPFNLLTYDGKKVPLSVFEEAQKKAEEKMGITQLKTQIKALTNNTAEPMFTSQALLEMPKTPPEVIKRIRVAPLSVQKRWLEYVKEQLENKGYTNTQDKIKFAIFYRYNQTSKKLAGVAAFTVRVGQEGKKDYMWNFALTDFIKNFFAYAKEPNRGILDALAGILSPNSDMPQDNIQNLDQDQQTTNPLAKSIKNFFGKLVGLFVKLLN